MRFEFATATCIMFGAGALREIGPLAADMGRRALVVTGRNTARAEPLLNALSAEGVGITLFPVAGEPTTETARQLSTRWVRHPTSPRRRACE